MFLFLGRGKKSSGSQKEERVGDWRIIDGITKDMKKEEISCLCSL